jgi:hypothetical protein
MHLGLELGDELLQVWQNVLPENWPFVGGAVGTGRDAGCTEAPELQLRLVPTIDAQSQPDWKYPEDAPWDIPAEDLDREHTCLLWLTREQIAKPRIDWSPAGLMHPLSSASFMDSNGIEVGLWDVEGIDHLDLQGDRNNPKPTPSCETYLGGFGGDGGGQTDPYPFQFEDGGHGQLLMNFVSAEDDGAMFAIFFRSNQLGRIEFGAIYYRYS